MTSFNFDDMFEEAEGAGFGPSDELDVGKYTATIVASKGGDDNTSKAGDPQLGFMFKADEGSVSADGEDMSGAIRWLNLTFSETGGKYAAADAKAMGLTSAMLNSDSERAAEMTVGQSWRIEVSLSKDKKYRNIRLKKRLDEDEVDDKPKAKKGKKGKAKAKVPVETEDVETQVVTVEHDEDTSDDEKDIWEI